jgi:RNA polymerase-binding transcription factor DksA
MLRKEFVDTARAKLLAHRAEILSRPAERELEDKDPNELREPDWASLTSDPVLPSGIDALSELERSELRAIHAALERIAAGDWGRCQRCGQQISSARLGASPQVITCLRCAGLEEEQRRRAVAPRQSQSFPPSRRRDRLTPPAAPIGEFRAPEEPFLRPERAGDEAVTARPMAKGGGVSLAEATVAPDELARYELEELTESEELLGEEASEVDEQLVHHPDETFPDRVRKRPRPRP